MTHLWPWIGFNLFVLAMLALDLGVFHRKSHEVGPKEALLWSGVWVALALTFNAGIFFFWPQIMPSSALPASEAAVKFLTGYLVEKALSIDNIFVILTLFAAFAIPAKYQHRVLFWGILGALVMRAGMIFAGVALLESFHWMIYAFGAILLVSAIKMAWPKKHDADVANNPFLRVVRRFLPVSKELDGDHFFTLENGKRMLTPLFVVLLLVEFTDLLFAVDSIPAVLSITDEPFLVYTSNVFAILGLRSLYFALAGLVGMFRFLTYGLSAILAFVGAKMMLSDVFHLSPFASLAVIVAILLVAIGFSVLFPAKETNASIKAM